MNMSVLLDVLKGRVMGSGRLLNVDHTISDYLTRGIGTVAARLHAESPGFDPPILQRYSNGHVFDSRWAL